MDPTTIVDLSHPLREPVPCYPGDPEFKITLACSFPLTVAESGPASDINPADETDQCDPHMVVRVHALSLGTHTGTHIDAPFHFFPSGQKLHEIPLSQFVGRAVVVDVRHLARDRAKITWADLTNSITSTTGGGPAPSPSPVMATMTALSSRIGSRTDGKADIVLLWTGWDVHWGTPAYFAHPYFSRDVAVALRDLGVRVVGVDMLSPDETPMGEGAGTEGGWGMHEVLLGGGVLVCENLRGLGELSNGEEETWVSMMPLSIHGVDGAPVRAYGWRQLPGAGCQRQSDKFVNLIDAASERSSKRTTFHKSTTSSLA